MDPYPSGHNPTVRFLEDLKKAIVERKGAGQTLEVRRVPTTTDGNQASSSLLELPSGREPVCGFTVYNAAARHDAEEGAVSTCSQPV